MLFISQQDRQRNTEARYESIVVVEKQYVLHIPVFVCVCVCVVVDARTWACTCARVALLIQHAKRHHIVCGLSGSSRFFDITS